MLMGVFGYIDEQRADERQTNANRKIIKRKGLLARQATRFKHLQFRPTRTPPRLLRVKSNQPVSYQKDATWR